MLDLRLRSDAYKVLRKEREKAGMTQVQLARRMGIKTSQQIYNFETKRNKLTLEYANSAAKALSIPLNAFLCKKVK